MLFTQNSVFNAVFKIGSIPRITHGESYLSRSIFLVHTRCKLDCFNVGDVKVRRKTCFGFAVDKLIRICSDYVTEIPRILAYISKGIYKFFVSANCAYTVFEGMVFYIKTLKTYLTFFKVVIIVCTVHKFMIMLTFALYVFNGRNKLIITANGAFAVFVSVTARIAEFKALLALLIVRRQVSHCQKVMLTLGFISKNGKCKA